MALFVACGAQDAFCTCDTYNGYSARVLNLANSIKRTSQITNEKKSKLTMPSFTEKHFKFNL